MCENKTAGWGIRPNGDHVPVPLPAKQPAKKSG